MTPPWLTPRVGNALTVVQVAYEHFNRELFAGELPPCLITLQRSKRCRAYYSPDRFARGDKRRGNVEYTDEIAMNPLYFGMRTPLETLSTLVHEMVHHWQRRLGTPTRRAYHDREWSAKMVGVGLQPSHTGLPGGKVTRQKKGSRGSSRSNKVLKDRPPTGPIPFCRRSHWIG